MAQIDGIYSYLQANYDPNEPIFLSELEIPGVPAVSLRPQIKKLVEDGRLKRFDTGIYFLPNPSLFRFGSMISPDDVIRKKYLRDGNTRCGYLSGIRFANQLGLTTQVPMVYEIFTNKATTDYRETVLGGVRIIIRRPYVKVNDANARALQFLDLIKEVSDISEVQGSELTERLTNYMSEAELGFDTLDKYLPYYPDRIYRKMYEVGLLNGVAT